MFKDADLDEALTTLGQLLQARGEAHDVVVIGGGALLLHGIIERPTKDLDAVARVEGTRWLRTEPFPAGLKPYAAADHWPDRSRQLADLRRLGPTPSRLLTAAKWCRSHDPSEGFRDTLLLPVLAELGMEDPDA